MQRALALVAEIAIAVFAISSMLSVGLGHRVREIVGPLRHPGAVIRALVANFVLVPILALLVVQVIALSDPLRQGLVLLSTAAGAPFLIKLSETAGSPLELAATLLLLLLPVTIIFMPVVVPVLLPGVRVSALAIAAPLFLNMLLPFAFGLLARERAPNIAMRLGPICAKISSVALVVLFVATIAARFGVLTRIGWRAALAAVVIILGGFAIGYLLGGTDPDKREVLGLGTGQRNLAAATVVPRKASASPSPSSW